MKRCFVLTRYTNERSQKITNPPQPSLKKGGRIGTVPSLSKGRLGWVDNIKIKHKAAFTLAEFFSPCRKVKLNFGFTLAEVLIVLGIIGVVAALTLPTLIANYKKQVYVAQLKKTYSALSQAFNQIAVNNGGTRFVDVAQLDGPSYQFNGDTAHYRINMNWFISELSKAIKITKVDFEPYNMTAVSKIDEDLGLVYPYYLYTSQGSTYNGGVYTTTDGAYISIEADTDSALSNIIMMIDINGKKGPNTLGRDIFLLVYGLKTNQLYPYGISFLINEGNFTKEQAESSLSDFVYNCEPSTLSMGLTCADKIIRNSWQMKY